METVKRFEPGMQFTHLHRTYVVAKRTRCYVTLAWDEVGPWGNVLHKTRRVKVYTENADDQLSEFCYTPDVWQFELWADDPDHETAAA